MSLHRHTPEPFEHFSDFLDVVFSAMDQPQRLRAICSRALASPDLIAHSTPADIALLVLLEYPQTLAARQTLASTQTVLLKPSSATRALGNVLGQQLRTIIFDEVEARTRALEDFPFLPLVAPSPWGHLILPFWAQIDQLYGPDNPFVRFASFTSQYMRDQCAPSPWIHRRLAARGPGLQVLGEFIDQLIRVKRIPANSVFRSIVAIYRGDAPLRSLDDINPDELMSRLVYDNYWERDDARTTWWPDNSKFLKSSQSPLLALLAELAAANGEVASEDRDRSVCAIIKRGLIEHLDRLAREYHYYTPSIPDYNRAVVRGGESAVLLPNWDSVIDASWRRDAGSLEDIDIELMEHVFAFQHSGYAPPQLLNGIYFDGLDADALREDWRLHIAIADLLNTAGSDGCDLLGDGWDCTTRVLDLLLPKTLYAACDALISCWLFLRLGILRASAHKPDAVASYIHRIPAVERPLIEKTLLILKDQYRTEGAPHAAEQLFSFIQPLGNAGTAPVVNLFPQRGPSREELTETLIDILGEEAWSALSEVARNDLIEAEIAYVSLRSRVGRQPPTPVRGPFMHWFSALEEELLISLRPAIERLKADFANSPVKKDHRLWRTQEAARKGALTLGEIDWLARNHDLLRDVSPNVSDAFQRSGLVQSVYREYGDLLSRLTQEYRNPASHSSNRQLSLTDAFLVRQELYRRGFLRSLVEARIKAPIAIDPEGGG